GRHGRAAVRDLLFHDLAADLLEDAARAVGGSVQHEHELLAAVARAEVERTPGGTVHRARDAADAVVARLMAVKVVVNFEAVDVDEHDLKQPSVAARLLPQLLGETVELA